MKKRNITFIIILLIASFAFFVIATSYNNDKTNKLSTAQETNKTLESNVSSSEQEKVQNSVLIDKIDNDPNQLAKDAKKEALKFIDVAEKNEGKADSDKQKIYERELNGFVSDNLRTSKDLTSISVPKDYDVDVSTHRGDSIPVLVSSKDRYLVIGYDSYSEQITSITEYKKA